jgi:hypothetical protein
MFPIVGNRYKCTVCKDYDVCEDCYVDDVHGEDGHTFFLIQRPGGPRRMVPARMTRERDVEDRDAVATDRLPTWDSQPVLKREFCSLEAAFDPRRSRTGRDQPLTLRVAEPGQTAESQPGDNNVPQNEAHQVLRVLTLLLQEHRYCRVAGGRQLTCRRIKATITCRRITVTLI